MERALRDARRCSSDPLCAEGLPEAPADFVHGAACHACLFISETACERGNSRNQFGEGKAKTNEKTQRH
jgi:hypothetical protein